MALMRRVMYNPAAGSADEVFGENEFQASEATEGPPRAAEQFWTAGKIVAGTAVVGIVGLIAVLSRVK